jgi:hypothetical protein
MTDIDHEKAVVAHLKKSLRALHMALAASIKAEYGHMVTDPIRSAIREIHVSLDVVEGRT